MAPVPPDDSADHDDDGTRTPASLLDRVRANDDEAWRRFVRLYSPLVYSWAKRCGLKNQDAADVLQDVFHAVARNVGQFQPDPAGGGFRGWLWVVTRNKVRDHFRGRGGEPVGGTDMQNRLQQIPEAEPESWSGAGGCGRAGMVNRVTRLVRDDFESHTWQAFWRLAVENHPARDIAADLGMTVDAVYQAKARVLRRLREELRGHAV